MPRGEISSLGVSFCVGRVIGRLWAVIVEPGANMRAVMVETVKVARDWLNEQLERGWDASDKSIRSLFDDSHAFNTAKGHGAGRDLLKKFLNSDWKEWDKVDKSITFILPTLTNLSELGSC